MKYYENTFLYFAERFAESLATGIFVTIIAFIFLFSFSKVFSKLNPNFKIYLYIMALMIFFSFAMHLKYDLFSDKSGYIFKTLLSFSVAFPLIANIIISKNK